MQRMPRGTWSCGLAEGAPPAGSARLVADSPIGGSHRASGREAYAGRQGCLHPTARVDDPADQVAVGQPGTGLRAAAFDRNDALTNALDVGDEPATQLLGGLHRDRLERDL